MALMVDGGWRGALVNYRNRNHVAVGASASGDSKEGRQYSVSEDDLPDSPPPTDIIEESR